MTIINLIHLWGCSKAYKRHKDTFCPPQTRRMMGYIVIPFKSSMGRPYVPQNVCNINIYYSSRQTHIMETVNTMDYALYVPHGHLVKQELTWERPTAGKTYNNNILLHTNRIDEVYVHEWMAPNIQYMPGVFWMNKLGTENINQVYKKTAAVCWLLNSFNWPLCTRYMTAMYWVQEGIQ